MERKRFTPSWHDCAAVGRRNKSRPGKGNYMNLVRLLKERPILVLESDDRNTADNEALAEALKKAGNSEVTEQHMRTDHAFSSDRNASRDRELAGRHRRK